jgi:hypothetical protein
MATGAATGAAAGAQTGITVSVLTGAGPLAALGAHMVGLGFGALGGALGGLVAGLVAGVAYAGAAPPGGDLHVGGSVPPGAPDDPADGGSEGSVDHTVDPAVSPSRSTFRSGSSDLDPDGTAGDLRPAATVERGEGNRTLTASLGSSIRTSGRALASDDPVLLLVTARINFPLLTVGDRRGPVLWAPQATVPGQRSRWRGRTPQPDHRSRTPEATTGRHRRRPTPAGGGRPADRDHDPRRRPHG